MRNLETFLDQLERLEAEAITEIATEGCLHGRQFNAVPLHGNGISQDTRAEDDQLVPRYIIVAYAGPATEARHNGADTRLRIIRGATTPEESVRSDVVAMYLGASAVLPSVSHPSYANNLASYDHGLAAALPAHFAQPTPDGLLIARQSAVWGEKRPATRSAKLYYQAGTSPRKALETIKTGIIALSADAMLRGTVTRNY